MYLGHGVERGCMSLPDPRAPRTVTLAPVNDHDGIPLQEAYIELLQRAVLGETTGAVTVYEPVGRPPRGRLGRQLMPRMLASERAVMARPRTMDVSHNEDGTQPVVVPPWTLTMVGSRRLDNVESCIRSVLEEDVPGDFIETGVWKGGTKIFMRGVLGAYGINPIDDDGVCWRKAG